MRCGLDSRVGKNPWRRPLATHSSILARIISQTEEPDGLQSSIQGHKESDTTKASEEAGIHCPFRDRFPCRNISEVTSSSV